MKSQAANQLSAILSETNSHLRDIASSINILSKDPWVMIGAATSFLLGIIALYIANKEVINSWFIKPKIEIDKHAFTLKQNTLLISRLLIKNVKKPIARNVTFWIDELWCYENDEWTKSSNFLHFPLQWTHANSEYKDLFFKRPYSLDLCQIICDVNNGKLAPRVIHLCTLYYPPKAHGLDDLNIGKNKLRLTLYCENHPIRHFYIEIEWDGTLNEPEIRIAV